ncbi:MAG: hypothetical protein KA712_04130 [Myxococcales bacterium]|nr:hypothetical protein [Myxococcales bacterium]
MKFSPFPPKACAARAALLVWLCASALVFAACQGTTEDTGASDGPENDAGSGGRAGSAGASQGGRGGDSGQVPAGGGGAGGAGGQPGAAGASAGGAAGASAGGAAGASAGGGGAQGAGGMGGGTPGGAGGGIVDATSPDPGHPPGDYVPMFVAVGHGRRIAFSCDDGRTWRDARKSNGTEGEESSGAAQGLAYGNGVFVAVFGWGGSGALERSDSGRSWQEVRTNGSGFGGVGFLGARFFAMDGGKGIVSSDGAAWSEAGSPGVDSHVRRVSGARLGASALGFVTGYEGTGDSRSGRRRLAVSADQGGTWKAVDVGDCVMSHQRRGGVACGAELCVSVSAQGNHCRSQDAGQSWTFAGSVGGGVEGFLWTGREFAAFDGGRGFFSDDGKTWRAQALSGSDNQIEVVARAASGTYAGLAKNGDAFHRSEDGRTWTRADGPSGSVFRHVVFGYGKRGGDCP